MQFFKNGNRKVSGLLSMAIVFLLVTSVTAGPVFALDELSSSEASSEIEEMTSDNTLIVDEEGLGMITSESSSENVSSSVSEESSSESVVSEESSSVSSRAQSSVTESSSSVSSRTQNTTTKSSSSKSSSVQSSSSEEKVNEEESTVVVNSYLAPAGYEEETRMGCTMEEEDDSVVVTGKTATPRNGNYSGIQGIDVSHWNGNINWAAVKAAGVKFVFVKVSGTSISSFSVYEDSKFRTNLAGAAAAGISVGAYHYSQALSPAEAAVEANYICDLVAGYSISMPIVMDYEWAPDQRLAGGGDLNTRTAVCNQFCESVRARGFTPCVYANDSCCKNNIDAAGLTASGANKLWVARYSSNFPSCNGSVDYWQYSSTGSVPGIAGNVDMDWWYGTGIGPSGFPTSGSSAYNYMYRMYNPNSGEHFYTGNPVEASNLTVAGWTYEGVGFSAPTKGTPVYRVYNPNAGDHHYTTSAGEKNVLVQKGWKYEGIAWRSGGNKNLYRAYNPNAKAGAHHFTTSKGEINWLVTKGWKYEGVGWKVK